MAGKKKDINPQTWEDVPEIPKEEQPYPLPEGWKWVNLLNSFYNKTDSKKKLQQKYYSEIGKFAIVDQGKNLIGGYSDDKNLVYTGDLPVIIFGDHTRCIKYIDFKFIQGADGIKVLLPKKYILPKYLFYVLQNVQFPDLGYRRHFPIFKNFYIPVAPLETQQRIVTHIESLFSKLDEAAEKVQAVIDSHEARKQAILHKAFSGELTRKWREENGVSLDSWEEKKLKDIGEITTGSTPSTKNKNYYGGTIPFIKPTDLNSGRYVKQSAEYLSESGRKVSRIVRAGSTCVCCIGTIGKCGFLTCDAVTNQQINSISPYKFMDDLYVYYYCLSDKFKNSLINNSSATTLSIINKSKMENLKIKIPSHAEQKEVVKLIEHLFLYLEDTYKFSYVSKDNINQLKKIILKKFLSEYLKL